MTTYETSTDEQEVYRPQYRDEFAQSVSNTFIDALLNAGAYPQLAVSLAQLGTFWTVQEHRHALWKSRIAAIALVLLGVTLCIVIVALSQDFWLLFVAALWIALVLIAYQQYWQGIARRELLKVRSFLPASPGGGV